MHEALRLKEHLVMHCQVYAKYREFQIANSVSTAIQTFQMFETSFCFPQEVLACTLVVFVGAVLSTFAPNYFWIMVFSAIVGLGMGGVAQW